MSDRAEPIESDFDAIKARVLDLRGQLRRAEDDLRAARLARLPIQVGDVATIVRGHKRIGDEVLVRDIELSGDYGCWFKCSFRKKDGDWSGSIVGFGIRDIERVEP
jgi:hypothetical protein